MGSGVALDKAALISTVLEGVLYGFSLLMFAGTIWVLTRNDGRRAPNWTMISIAIALLVLGTAHMIIDIVRIDEGLVKYRNTFFRGPVAFFADASQYTYVAENVIYVLQTLVGDGVVIYRCYVVWQSFWIILLPSVLWCSVSVTGVGAVYSISEVAVHGSDMFARSTSHWIAAFFASTLSTNLLSAGLLAYRIWTIERNVALIRTSKSTLTPVLHVIIDAALLYSIALFITLVCLLTSNNLAFVVVNLITPIISIAFYMVLIRAALGRSNNSHHVSVMSWRVCHPETTHGIQPLQLDISQFSSNDATLLDGSGNQAERDSKLLVRKGEDVGAAYKV